MKLFSKRGTRVIKFEHAIEHEEVRYTPEDTVQIQSEPVQPEAVQVVKAETVSENSEQKLFEEVFKPKEISKGKLQDIPNGTPGANEQKPVQTQAPSAFVYPETTLTKKQLEAIQSVIGPPQTETGEGDEDGLDAQDISGDSHALHAVKTKQRKAKKRSPETAELKIKDRTIIKTVFSIIFLVMLLGAGAYAGFYYWWTEHATFEYVLQPVVILEGQSIAPNDFLYPAEEMEGVTAVFNDPDFEPFVGLQFVPMTLSSKMRTLESAAALYVLTPIEYREHEFAAEGATLRPVEFLENPEIVASVSSDFVDIVFLEPPLPLEEYPVGEFPIKLSLNGIPFEVMLIVTDTTPPTATPVDVTIEIGHPVHPEMFVDNVYDASGIKSIAFVEEPDVFARTVSQEVHIIIEDYNENKAVIISTLYTIMSQSDPIIEVVHYTIESQIGNPVNYLEGVSAYDEFLNPLVVYVIDNDVNIDEIGTYTAILRAEDLSGMYTEVPITIHIINSDPEEVNRRVDEILHGTNERRGIINTDMTQTEMAKAIHLWIFDTLSRSTTDRRAHSLTDEAAAALDTIRSGSNSRGYSSLASFMLTRVGIENIRVERIPEARSRHYWLLINIDDGWYHFDAFPTGVIPLRNETHKFTAKQAEDFAGRVKNWGFDKIDDYYTFVTTDDMPAIVQG